MIYRLAAFLSVVDDDSESGFESLLQRHLGRHDEQMADQRLVLGGRVAQLRDRLARDHEEVSGSLRTQITEGHALIILVQEFRRNLAASDLAWSRGRGHSRTAGANNSQCHTIHSCSCSPCFYLISAVPSCFRTEDGVGARFGRVAADLRHADSERAEGARNDDGGGGGGGGRQSRAHVCEQSGGALQWTNGDGGG